MGLRHMNTVGDLGINSPCILYCHMKTWLSSAVRHHIVIAGPYGFNVRKFGGPRTNSLAQPTQSRDELTEESQEVKDRHQACSSASGHLIRWFCVKAMKVEMAYSSHIRHAGSHSDYL